MYFYIFLSLSLLVYVFSYNEIVAYLLAYSSAYLVDYILTLKFVFRETHSWTKPVKYIVYILFFLALNTYIYVILLNYFSSVINPKEFIQNISFLCIHVKVNIYNVILSVFLLDKFQILDYFPLFVFVANLIFHMKAS